MSITSTGGAGFSSSSYGAVLGSKPIMRTIENEVSSNLIGTGIGSGPIRPPLYVPTKRDSGRTSTLRDSTTPI
jgi:hypothetical protein